MSEAPEDPDRNATRSTASQGVPEPWDPVKKRKEKGMRMKKNTQSYLVKPEEEKGKKKSTSHVEKKKKEKATRKENIQTILQKTQKIAK